MIRYLELRNWRALDKIALHFNTGISFIVAENGIGKTSVLRGAAWALFGDSHVDPAPELRRNSNAVEATGIVVVDTSVGRLELERTFRNRRGRKPEPIATLDSHGIKPDDIDAVLTDAFGADPAFAAQLGFVHQHALVTDATFFAGVKGFLRQLTGVASLESSKATMVRVERALNKRATDLAREDRASSARTDQLRAQLDVAVAREAEAEARVASAEAVYNQHRTLADGIRQWNIYLNELDHYRTRQRQIEGNMADLTRSATLRDLVDVRQSFERAAAQAQAAAQVHRDLLGQLGDMSVCPVCRQYIDDYQAETATHHHQAAIATALKDYNDVADQLAAATATLEELERLQQELNDLVEPDKPDMECPAADTTSPEALQASARELELASAALVEARTSRAAIRRNLDEAESDKSALRQVSAARRLEAAAAATVDVLDRSINYHVATRIDPLSDALTVGWGQFFTTDGQIELTADGDVVMRLDAGHVLPYSQLSGGQQSLAVLTLRLALVSSATTLGSVWLDEPLEHLDPTNRRRAANLLHAATAEPSTAQVMATTYEEDLARRLAAQHDDVHLHYVRSD